MKKGSAYNFSERNMMNSHGFDPNYLQGGNREMAMAYLSRWSGPVNEGDDIAFNLPNPGASTNGYMPDKIRKHVQDTLYIESRDIAAMKKAIREYGAVITTLYWDFFYYNSVQSSYNYNIPDNPKYNILPNHSVTLVGWDDHYSKNNFSPAAASDGAFIVKNSWGGSWGNHGYFYLSYKDTMFGTENYAFTRIDSTGNYYRVYQYDTLGWVGSYGATGSNTCWFSNVFAAPKQNETLSAVGFYTTAPGASYAVFVAKSVSGAPPSFAGATPVATGTQAYAGYHTVDIKAAALTSSSKFAVAIKITNPSGYNYSQLPVAGEEYYYGYSSKASASAGQSFLSASGASWTDATKLDPTLNVCLKAFTKAGAGAVAGVSLNKTSHQLNKGATYQLSAKVSPSSAISKKVVWRSSNTKIAAVSSIGKVTAKAAGKAVLTATTEAGLKTASCTVEVVSSTKVCNVSVSKVSGNSLRLGWSKLSVSGSKRYYVYYKTSASGSYKLLTSTTGSYKDITKLSNNKTYYFKVRARVSGKYKEYSAATGGTKIAVNTQVRNVKASKVTKSSLRLSWAKIPLYGFSMKYYIYYKTSASGSYELLADTAGTYKDIKYLKSGKTYYFRVRAKISGQWMAYSPELQIRMK